MNRRRLLYVAGVVVALIVGVAIGGSGKKKQTTAARTVTNTVTVRQAAAVRDVVRPDCRAAILDARLAYTVTGDAFSRFSKLDTVAIKAITAASNQNTAEMASLVPQISAINTGLHSDETADAAHLAAFATAAKGCQ